MSSQCRFVFEITTMNKYVNKVAIVTGASSGIGAGLSKELAKRGCIVIGLAGRMDKLKVGSCISVNIQDFEEK